MPLALWQAIKLLGIWGKFGSGLSWIAQSSTRLLAAACLVLALVAYWQHHEADKQARVAAHTKAAWEAARKDAQAATELAEQRSKEKADASQKYQAALDDVAGRDARFAAFAAGQRLRHPTQANPARAAENHGAAIPAIPAPETILAEIDGVWISRADWNTCDALWPYGQAAHEWAIEFNAAPPK